MVATKNMVMILDYSENCTIIYLVEAQSMHFQNQNQFIIHIPNSTIIQRRFLIIAKKHWVIIVTVGEHAFGFFTLDPWLGDQEKRQERLWKVSWDSGNSTGL